MKFTAWYLEEPDLIFGGRQEEKDPRVGLRRFGPFYTDDEKAPTPSQVRVGIVGTGRTIDLARRVVDELAAPIPSGHFNRWAHPDFDGFSVKSAVKCELVTASQWNASILQQEVERITNTPQVNTRIAVAANLVSDKVAGIATEESPPDVIIVALPQPLVDSCGIGEQTRGAKKPRFTRLERTIAELREKHQRFLDEWGLEVAERIATGDEADYDLRNAIKGKVMRNGIPVQILREETAGKFLDASGEKDGSLIRSSFAWNFATGLYYKAKGRPWRLAKLTPGTCYVGISFFRDLRSPRLDLQSSMAQVFTHSGDGFVLRGSEVVVDPGSKEAHLEERQASELLRAVLTVYGQKAGTSPSRVVLHKTSKFSEAERAGFGATLGNLRFDYVTISTDSPVRFLRWGDYPVLRGTMIGLTDQESLLYTTGYVPRIRTYPGRRVPDPLLVSSEGASDRRLIAREILGLTKLNWNTTVFSTRLPITLEFAKKVGKVLSELDSGALVQDHYRFYM